jgi:two-component system phosphate regulon sensor histidine kinase PhoR
MRSRTFRNILIVFSLIIILALAILWYLLNRIYQAELFQYSQYGNDVFRNFPERNVLRVPGIRLAFSLALLLFISLLIFGVVLYHLYRERYWNGIQKDFVNNLMHEFRTPVSVISIASKVLQDEGIESQPNRLRQYAGIIKLQADELHLKSTQVMDWALLDSKAVQWNKEKVDIHSIVARALDFIQPLVDEKQANIKFHKAGSACNILADATYLAQAIVNLLDNSLKYSTTPQIELRIEMNDKTCVLCVKDNGIGIEEKYVRHVFRKFYRIPTGNRHNVKGFGIGLNFVKEVVNAHHGRIELNSITGRGTEIKLRLPLC